MPTLRAQIQDPADVAKAVAAMGNPDCGYKKIELFKHVKDEVDKKGNQAVRDHIAQALENCRVNDVHIRFEYCNLDQASVQLLANAMEKNTCIGGFSCTENCEPMKQAIIASKAPITIWNGGALSQDMVEARRQRAANEGPFSEMIQALIGYKLDAETAKACAMALQKDGFGSLEKLAFVEESDLANYGLNGFTKRMVLSLKASLNASKPVVRAAQSSSDFTTSSMPPLPHFYAFLSQNWGEDKVNRKRVQGIVSAFSAKEWPMWFDAERLTEHVDVQITKGMDASATFVVFITKAYVEKVESGGAGKDWCHFEFNYASMTKLRKMIAVVMDKEMLDQTKWKGPVGWRLGNMPYIDYTSEDKFELACGQLARAIADKM